MIPGGAGRAGRRRRARGWLALGIAATLVLGACASSDDSSSSDSGGKKTTSSVKLGDAKPAADVGITDTEIHVAVIADVETQVNPGLFQKTLDAVKAWGEIVNENGGLAGRKLVVDAMDSKLDPNTARNAVIKACQQDFALVGTQALLLTDLSDVEGCKDARGQSLGLPNLSSIPFGPLQQCSPVSYAVFSGNPTYCATKDDPSPTFTVQAGDAKWYKEQTKDAHGIWIYNSDVPTAQTTQVPVFVAASNTGIKKDGEGFYSASGSAPQSALTPIVSTIKRNNSTYVNGGSTPPNMVLLRKEAELQGVKSVKTWVCSAGCYVPYFLTTGGSSVEGTYQTLNTLAFFTEYKDNKALKALIDKLGGVDKVDSNSISAYVEALLFQEAVEKIVSSGKTLTRQALFDQLKNTHEFDAEGIIGKTDVGARTPSPCFAVAQVVSGKWQRVYPKKAGTFDCAPDNIVEVQVKGAKK
jgi:ABC-type branched-subunit amino acid transport system substrate-binding protein